MESFRGLRIDREKEGIQARLETLHLEDLSPGSVVIRAYYSSVNYKDALAATGKGNILRRFPLVGGIDVSGVVESSADPRFRPGEKVLVTGYGLGSDHDGGYADYVRVPADWVVPLSEGLSLYGAMALGTAGFTAALAIQRMEDNGQRPDRGPVLVTGATGGVGNLAIDMLAGLGYPVVALTGKREAVENLKTLGASQILFRQELEMGQRPLEKGQWGGAVDTAGGDTLGWLTRTVLPWGNIASIGLAGGSELHTTVMPFILRGVSLLGISSADCPMPLRQRIWQRLATDLRPRHLNQIVTGRVSLEELLPIFEGMLAGAHRGRTVVKIRDDEG
ncbi:oxidoreductase [Nitrosococcus oceani]|uniref:oxidoreductase n=1 Tax=Nitrosococcus oceani TaxID=1229 RepID=UPI0004E8F391|nr:oxidoreductase [Nitrosococcus oceani]KFI22277.1 quinone oxidoreductase [Nitrosococcus oceani]